MRLKNKISLIVSATLLSPTMVLAAQENPADKASNYNITLISLVSLMIILLFVIGMLASTLTQLSHVVKERKRAEKKNAIARAALLLIALTLGFTQTFAADAPATAQAVKAATPAVIGGMSSEMFYLIISVIALELLVIFMLVVYIRLLLVAIRSKTEAEAGVVARKRSWFWDKFNAAAPLEKEKDVLLDHDYDGIQELDNSLPPWWKYGFYLTIIVACIYIYRYHIAEIAPSSHDEYVAEMQKGEEQRKAYLAQAGNNVDETNVTQLTDATEIGAGKEIFVKNCAPCHLADGGGIVGPNLTDEYWIHGGSIKDVFKSIKYGWQEKGMKSWKDDFTPKQIQQLASFVKSLKGTKPATPKAPQGELYIEAGTAQPGADSTKKVTNAGAITAQKVANK